MKEPTNTQYGSKPTDTQIERIFGEGRRGLSSKPSQVLDTKAVHTGVSRKSDESQPSKSLQKKLIRYAVLQELLECSDLVERLEEVLSVCPEGVELFTQVWDEIDALLVKQQNKCWTEEVQMLWSEAF